MKEKIYTIPVNEAFDERGECPLCTLRHKLETEAVDYALGPAMMEPDYRIVSNEKGYCNRHFAMMLPKKEKLSLALVLDTYLNELVTDVDSMAESIEKLTDGKKGLFAKKGTDTAAIAERLFQKAHSCVICDKIASAMSRYIEVVFYLWDRESEFRDKLLSSKGFCLEHFAELIKLAPEFLSSKKSNDFISGVYEIEQKELRRLNEEVHKFTLKFDYRAAGEPWGSEQDAPKRAVEKLSGKTE